MKTLITATAIAMTLAAGSTMAADGFAWEQGLSPDLSPDVQGYSERTSAVEVADHVANIYKGSVDADPAGISDGSGSDDGSHGHLHSLGEGNPDLEGTV